VSSESWIALWKWCLIILGGGFGIMLFWVGYRGFLDLREMLRDLASGEGAEEGGE